jgi:hypothetical protein
VVIIDLFSEKCNRYFEIQISLFAVLLRKKSFFYKMNQRVSEPSQIRQSHWVLFRKRLPGGYDQHYAQKMQKNRPQENLKAVAASDMSFYETKRSPLFVL